MASQQSDCEDRREDPPDTCPMPGVSKRHEHGSTTRQRTDHESENTAGESCRHQYQTHKLPFLNMLRPRMSGQNDVTAAVRQPKLGQHGD